MLAKLKTFTLVGIEAIPVEVEVDAAMGMPKTLLVGLPEAAVKESLHRIERALINLGYSPPTGRVVINLAPADLKKDASSFDLPIALGILVGTGQVKADDLDQCAIVGELALDGNTRSIKGALAVALASKANGIKRMLVSAANAREAAVVEDIEVYPISDLAQAVGFISGQLELQPMPSGIGDLFETFNKYDVDFADVRGQDYAKRALVIAAAGGHNVLLSGPPGAGKTMLARRLPSILPALTPAESLETTRIYSAMGLLNSGRALLTERPFRSPHHTVSNAGLVGGGSTPTPGEISLAHHGVLFLDELPEFTRTTLEVLRQPLEEGKVTISRALRASTFPAHFILIAAMNPCPCGFLGDTRRACKCNPPQIERYVGKISGPLLDRIDLHVEVPAVSFEELNAKQPANGVSSATLQDQVMAARKLQRERFGDTLKLNGKMPPRMIRQTCILDETSQRILKTAVESIGLSARAHDRILRVSRTIADLENAASIEPRHITEALNYRILDRKLWMK